MSEYVMWLDEKRKDVVDTDAIYKVSRPAEMREPIVRCKDCKHYLKPGSIVFDNGSLNRGACSIIRAYVVDITPDGFCAWGETKKEN